MRYSLLGGGKRIRPIIVLATVACLKGDEQKALPFACAIELIHIYSLIHDDLPCMDNDDYRRGKLTNHKVYGEGHAVLTGDALLTEAFGWMARADYIDPRTILTIINEGVHFCGAHGMVGGQVNDIEAAHKIITKNELDAIYSHKTGDLLCYSVRTGAHLCNASEEILTLLTQFARCLGLAFQIQDDILDVIKESDSLENDLNNTYPDLIGVEESKKNVYQLTEKAKGFLDCLEAKGIDSSLLRQIADYLLTRNY